MVSFVFAGVRCRASFGFFAVAAIFLFVDGGGFALAFLGGALLHELAHLAALAFFRCPVRMVELSMGGMRLHRSHSARLGPGGEAAVLLAGPGANLLLAMLLPLLGQGMLEFSAANSVLAAYHLLPVGGLDGGSLLELACVHLLGAHRGARVAAAASLCFCLAAVAGLSLAAYLYGLSPGIVVMLVLFISTVVARPSLG